LTLWLALLLALAGGAVLNLMPCVFPVLSIKALSLVQQAHGSRSAARRHGLAYTAGALVSFALLALILIALKAAGSQVGWGFQFQSPVFVGGVAGVLFAVGLSLSGVFAIGAGITGFGSDAASRPGYAGSFFSGVLAAVVATPCTAPFMGAAVAYALTQPGWQLLLVFQGLGLGLAAPYLLLSCWPPMQRWLPRPGVWMETLKQALAFPMYGAAIWLVWVIAQQSGAQGVLQVLTGLGLLAFAAWVYQRAATASLASWRRAGHATALLSTTLALTCVAQLTPASNSGTSANAHADFEPYTPARLDALRAQGKPVFVNLTAAWCISCLVNERVALSQPEVRQALLDGGVTYLKGDWTQKDPQITALLARHGRSGVPLYLYYPSGSDAVAVVLPQILTPGMVTTVLNPSSRPPT
jgi:thiol:disulfide interchange protein DsbD